VWVRGGRGPGVWRLYQGAVLHGASRFSDTGFSSRKQAAFWYSATQRLVRKYKQIKARAHEYYSETGPRNKDDP
jgi:hypothetical protein